MRGNVGDPRRTHSARPVFQQHFHRMPEGVGGDLRPEFERRRTENRLALCRHAVPVEGGLEASVPDVKRFAGADHCDAAPWTIGERSEHVAIDIHDLDAFDPRRAFGNERLMESFSAPRAVVLPRLQRSTTAITSRSLLPA